MRQCGGGGRQGGLLWGRRDAEGREGRDVVRDAAVETRRRGGKEGSRGGTFSLSSANLSVLRSNSANTCTDNPHVAHTPSVTRIGVSLRIPLVSS